MQAADFIQRRPWLQHLPQGEGGNAANLMLDTVRRDKESEGLPAAFIGKVLVAAAQAAERTVCAALCNHFPKGRVHNLLHIAAGTCFRVHRDVADAEDLQGLAADVRFHGKDAGRGKNPAVFFQNNCIFTGVVAGLVELGQYMQKTAFRARLKPENKVDEFHVLVIVAGRASALVKSVQIHNFGVLSFL